MQALWRLDRADHAVLEQTQQFTFRYDDSDTLIAELQEFFPYIEVNSLPEGLREFQSEFRDRT